MFHKSMKVISEDKYVYTTRTILTLSIALACCVTALTASRPKSSRTTSSKHRARISLNVPRTHAMGFNGIFRVAGQSMLGFDLRSTVRVAPSARSDFSDSDLRLA